MRVSIRITIRKKKQEELTLVSCMKGAGGMVLLKF